MLICQDFPNREHDRLAAIRHVGQVHQFLNFVNQLATLSLVAVFARSHAVQPGVEPAAASDQADSKVRLSDRATIDFLDMGNGSRIYQSQSHRVFTHPRPKAVVASSLLAVW